MNNIKHITLLASAALLALASCSTDDQQDDLQAGQLPIRLAHNLAADTDVTRASGNYTYGFTAGLGSDFYVWADMFDEGEANPLLQTREFISAWFLQVNALETQLFQTAQTHLFPVYNSLSFYGIHGNFAQTITAESSGFPNSYLTHSVKTAQRSDDDYLASDLVYAIQPSVKPTKDYVTLPFHHMLTKIEVALKAGNQMTDAQMTDVDLTKVTVSIVGTKTQVEFTPGKKNLAGADLDLSDLAVRQAMLSIPETAEPQPVTLSTVPTIDFTTATCGAAVVVPQTVNGRFICLHYQDHDIYYSVDNLQLLSGYRYRFNLTVDRIGTEFVVTPNVTVSPWDVDTDVVADLDANIETTNRN